MKFVSLGLTFTVLLLTGCAATVQKSSDAAPIKASSESARHIAMNVTGPQQITASGDWEPFKGEWRSAMKSAAQAIGSQFSLQEGKPEATGEPGTLVVVNVKDYRYISPGARFAFGAMTGNAFVDSSVEFRDLKTGTLLGEKRYNTSSSAWQGIFSPMTDKQIQAITTEIATEIKAR
jgi:hypothetical protein